MTNWLREVFYLLFYVVSVIVVFIGSVFLAALLTTALGDRPVQLLYANPAYPVPVVIGFAAGFMLNRQFRSKSATFGWVLFSVPIWWAIWDYRHMSYPGFQGTLHYLFSPHCGDCFEQVLTIAPFSISIAYSLGAWIAMKWHPNSAEADESLDNTPAI